MELDLHPRRNSNGIGGSILLKKRSIFPYIALSFANILNAKAIYSHKRAKKAPYYGNTWQIMTISKELP